MNRDQRHLPCIAPLENPVQQYAWGNTQGILPFIEAKAGPGYPIGEVWMGSHRLAPSKLRLDAGPLPLDALIRQAPLHWLGTRVADQYHDLPFLFTVRAAGSPLSLQVHPTLEEAREGFAKEERAGIPLSAPQRIFKDSNHKPELAVALTPFRAIAGFRESSEISDLLGPELCRAFNFKGQRPEELRNFVRHVFSKKGDAYKIPEAGLRARAEELLRSNSERAREAGAMALDLQALYPHDPGQFGPLILNILSLEPGEGLFVPAGVIHAYVRGSILEIMACSDNVIRAGLTIKHIDVDLLCDILKPEARPEPIRPDRGHFGWGSRVVYAVPAREFRLEYLDANPEGAAISYAPAGPEILLCTEGSFRVRAEDELALPARASCFVAGSCTAVRLEGAGRLWRATSGEQAL
jgi:mannose-6-phosphate isomerase